MFHEGVNDLISLPTPVLDRHHCSELGNISENRGWPDLLQLCDSLMMSKKSN